LTRNRYLVDGLNTELEVRVAWESLKLIFGARVSHFDKALSGFASAIGSCAVSAVKLLWPPEAFKSGTQLGEFIYQFPEILNNADLLMYYGSDDFSIASGASDEKRAEMFGQGIGNIVCIAVSLILPKALGKLSQTKLFTTLKAGFATLAETRFAKLGEVFAQLKNVDKLDEALGLFNKLNKLPDKLIMKFESWWFIKQGKIIEKEVKFAAMNDSEKIEAIRLAKDGYTVKPLQFKNDHLYYDFDVWKKGNLPKGMGDIAVEVKHIESSDPARINVNILKANSQLIENGKLPDSGYISLNLDKTDITIETATKVLEKMRSNNYNVEIVKDGIFDWFFVK